ncbi:ubiquitin-like modifier-activating enzyme ATG7 [Papilio machaon]|uniref:ubiquitin-like modifier-activating enzyme ATG7 n=1 Tax=Papilio machaon TaxID=76193 RepID=UPI001E663B81|nr:ubiquitin-like modifier-activating enzyme ATG7 [Papilio machaon]
MSTNKELKVVQYVPFKSFVHPSFWHSFTDIKLNIDKLEEAKKDIYGRYTYREDVGTVFEVDGTSFNKLPETEQHYINVKGTLINVNKLEDFKHSDKGILLNNAGEEVWLNVKSKAWITEPSRLINFFIYSYSDLKKYRYYYWFGFPCPNQPTVYINDEPVLITTIFNEQQLEQLNKGFNALDLTQRHYFTITKNTDFVTVDCLSKILDAKKQVQSKNDIDLSITYFAFTDPSCSTSPGWPMRLFIAALLDHCPDLYNTEINIIGLRYSANGSLQKSQVYNVKIPQISETSGEGVGWVGWERNEKGALGPKLAVMSASMDPIKLAESSSDLNMRLMKWRLVPDLDLDVMKRTKCLLLGAGTLGCHVARNLLAWGFRNITFVDNAKVSYSNPTRQVLYTHEDCLNGGKKKAEAAANSLKNILPTVNSKSIFAHIPMPGYPVGEDLMEEMYNNVKLITDAIVEHDVIFLLLDSREARWLPTVIAALHSKIVINAALGFDSYLVMRHGVGLNAADAEGEGLRAATVPGGRLGCYFCNDVTAPGNTFAERTLDQQCTVTRPGVAAIAGALAVEMLAALLQHPLGVEAPAVYNPDNKEIDSGDDGVLGSIPHSIRGFLHSYQSVLPTCAKFKQCIACSDVVLNTYKDKGTEFLLKVFESGKHLERITGLEELHKSAEMSDMLAFSDDEDQENIDNE